MFFLQKCLYVHFYSSSRLYSFIFTDLIKSEDSDPMVSLTQFCVVNILRIKTHPRDIALHWKMFAHSSQCELLSEHLITRGDR